MAQRKAAKPAGKSRRDKYNKAFKVYIQGGSIRATAEAAGCDTKTVMKWEKADSWKEYRESVFRQAKEEIKKEAVKETVDYVLNISKLQKDAEVTLDSAEVKSYEGVLRALCELEKVKILRNNNGLQYIGLFTADDILKAKREAQKNEGNAEKGQDNA